MRGPQREVYAPSVQKNRFPNRRLQHTFLPVLACKENFKAWQLFVEDFRVCRSITRLSHTPPPPVAQLLHAAAQPHLGGVKS